MNENDTTAEDLWDEWSFTNWDDDQDMEHVERAFKAGYAAAQASSAAVWDAGKAAGIIQITAPAGTYDASITVNPHKGVSA